MNAHFEGHADEILSAMHEAAITALEAIGIQAEGYPKKTLKLIRGDCATAFRTRWTQERRRYISGQTSNTAYTKSSARGNITPAAARHRGHIRTKREIGIGRAATKRSRSCARQSKTTGRPIKIS